MSITEQSMIAYQKEKEGVTVDIIELYEDLKKYMEDETQYDDLFYDAPEGEVQIDIVGEIMKNILDKIG